MSNVTKTVEAECDTGDACDAIELLIEPRSKDLGGFEVRRALPVRQHRMVGPWVFFDHMGPADFEASTGIDVRPHPHVNLATVTYLFEGEILHRDSLGTVQAIRPGDINLMVAGRGIVHSERERAQVRAVPHRLHGLQLWMALPEADEEVEPAFHHYPSDEIPALSLEDVPVRVMMGTAYGVTSPVRVFSDTLYVEAHLQAGQSLELPAAGERALYVADGALSVGGTAIARHSMAVLAPDQRVVVCAGEESRIALIGGENLGPRFMEWNFVSSRRERIEQAKADWKARRFPTVPGDEEEFIPLPE